MIAEEVNRTDLNQIGSVWPLAEQVTEVFQGRRRNRRTAIHFTGNRAFNESLCEIHRAISFEAILYCLRWVSA